MVPATGTGAERRNISSRPTARDRTTAEISNQGRIIIALISEKPRKAVVARSGTGARVKVSQTMVQKNIKAGQHSHNTAACQNRENRTSSKNAAGIRRDAVIKPHGAFISLPQIKISTDFGVDRNRVVPIEL